ncbi:MAG: sigma-70 family RNA polymerase sigma factor [Microgenomates group bacterium]
MTFKPETTSYAFPQSKLDAGSINHTKNGKGYVMDIQRYLQLIGLLTEAEFSMDRQLTEITPHSYGVNALLKTLVICLPTELQQYFKTIEQQDLYAELNLVLGEQFQVARGLLDERLAELKISESQLPSFDLDDQTQTAISQLQEHAWYLVLLNHRVIYTIIRAHPQWSNLEPVQQQDLYQLTLISCWQSACRHKPEQGSFLTYLHSYLADGISTLVASVQGITRNYKMFYLDSYKDARAHLRGTIFDTPYWHEIYSCMVFDRKKNRLSYKEPLRALMVYERAYRGIRPKPDENEILQWQRPIHNLREQLDRDRLPRLRQVLDLAYPLSLDQQRLIHFKDTHGEPATLYSDFFYRLSGESLDIPDLIDQHLLEERIVKIFTHLTDMEALVLKLHYGLHGMPEYTLKEVAEIIGKTYERARQIEKSALHKLNQPNRSYLLTEFRAE